jgi:hypothetical protein
MPVFVAPARNELVIRLCAGTVVSAPVSRRNMVDPDKFRCQAAGSIRRMVSILITQFAFPQKR